MWTLRRDRAGRWLAPALGLILAFAAITPQRAWAAVLAPPSDLLVEAVTVPGVTTPGFSLTTTVDMTGSTYPDVGEPAACGADPTRTTWYRFTADVSGSVTLSTVGSDVGDAAVRFHQYRASVGGLYSYPCATSSTFAVNVVAAGEYWIQLSANDTGTNLVLAISFSSIPPNDRFAMNRLMSGVWSTDAVDISRATSDVGEPVTPCGGSGRTVWYRYPATADASISIDPSASTTAGTVFAAYRSIGSGFAGLVPLACGTRGLTFNIHAGDVYYIQASDVGAPGGYLAFRWSLGTPGDMLPPVISDTPADMFLTTTSAGGRVVTYSLPTAVDDVSGVVPVTCAPASGSLFPIGRTRVSCTARDAAGNVASTGFWMTIEQKLAVPAGIPIASYDVRATPVSGWCGWNHRYDGTLVPTGGIQGGCYWATTGDYSGGSGTLTDGYTTGKSDTQLLTKNTDEVSGQHLRPAITLHLDGTYLVSGLSVYGGATTELEAGLLYAVTVEIGGASVRIVTQPFGTAGPYGPTNDRIDLTGTALAAIPTSTVVLRDFEAMLPWGNEFNTFAVSEITVAGTAAPTDLTPPELTIPADLTAEAIGPTGAPVSFDASAIDAVDGTVAVTCAPASGSTFAIGTTAVSCSASDASGNEATRSFEIAVHDTLAPTVAYGAHPTTYVLTDTIHVTCTATDAVGVVSSTCSNVDGSGWSFGLGGQTFEATASDGAGNVGSASTTFVVVATYGSVVDLTRAWSSKAGVAKDLVAILDAAAAAQSAGRDQAEAGKLAEYRSAVLAQAGKAFSLERARMLAVFTSGL